jgi:maltose/moltooligosaccharide transporter
MNMNATKPLLGFWQIWNMCFGFLGIQFGFALQNANVGRIFQTLGAKVDELPILFLAAPVTGLLIQPLIGYMSDKTWTFLGRRRPYFLTGAILATIALFVMPNCTLLWLTVICLWLLNSAINIAMEPFRSFVCDMLPNEQRTKAFAMQAFFIGIGSVVASALPWIFTNWLGVSNTAPAGEIPNSVIYSFYLGGAAFISAVLVTVITTPEYSPLQLDAFEQSQLASKSANTSKPKEQKILRSTQGFFTHGLIWLAIGILLSIGVFEFELTHELYVLTIGTMVFGALQILTGHLQNTQRSSNGLCEVMNDLIGMPKAMRQLALVQFYSWFALFSMWIYTISAVTEYHYGTTDTTSAIYNEGANWVGILFASYNAFSALAAFIIPMITRVTSRKTAHMINLCLGGIGLISFYFIQDPKLLIISMIGVGFAWASILSMPYAILAGSLPANKAGIYMGIFNLFITIPQILASTILGLMVRELFHDKAILALVCGGVAMILAAISTLWVEDTES